MFFAAGRDSGLGPLPPRPRPPPRRTPGSTADRRRWARSNPVQNPCSPALARRRKKDFSSRTSPWRRRRRRCSHDSSASTRATASSPAASAQRPSSPSSSLSRGEAQAKARKPRALGRVRAARRASAVDDLDGRTAGALDRRRPGAAVLRRDRLREGAVRRRAVACELAGAVVALRELHLDAPLRLQAGRRTGRAAEAGLAGERLVVGPGAVEDLRRGCRLDGEAAGRTIGSSSQTVPFIRSSSSIAPDSIVLGLGGASPARDATSCSAAPPSVLGDPATGAAGSGA